MSRSAISLVVVAGLFGATGVATAAAAAHVTGDPRLATVAQFLMLHGAALLGAAAAAEALRLERFVTMPAWGIALGVLMFGGDLLVRVFHGSSPLPMTAPVGGTILIASWLALAVGAAIGGLRRKA